MIVGRDTLVEVLWKKLGRQHGLVLTANRRIGKTTIMREMQRGAPERGYTAIYHDLEAIRSVDEFTQVINYEVHNLKDKPGKFASKTGAFYDRYVRDSAIGNLIKFGGKAKEKKWQELIDEDIAFLVKEKAPCILFLDEFPIMLSNIITDHGEKAAMAILDKMRQIRQTHKDKIKMVFTGSIGIHLVIERLKRAGYTNEALNDMAYQEVGPIEVHFAQELATQLLASENVNLDDLKLNNLIEAVDCIPFYIGELVSEVVADGAKRDPADLLKECLSDGRGHWNLRHFDHRITQYYNKPSFAYQIIDYLAFKGSSSVSDITARARLVGEITDNEVLAIIHSLCQDQYFVRNDDSITFRFRLISTWWQLHRRCS